MQSQCHCIIRHALTESERKTAADQLNYARRVDDKLGVMLAIMVMAPCPSNRESNAPRGVCG